MTFCISTYTKELECYPVKSNLIHRFHTLSLQSKKTRYYQNNGLWAINRGRKLVEAKIKL